MSEEKIVKEVVGKIVSREEKAGKQSNYWQFQVGEIKFLNCFDDTVAKSVSLGQYVKCLYEMNDKFRNVKAFTAVSPEASKQIDEMGAAQEEFVRDAEVAPQFVGMCEKQASDMLGLYVAEVYGSDPDIPLNMDACDKIYKDWARRFFKWNTELKKELK